MSVLSSTNSGLYSQPLTPEVAKLLGWYIKREDGQKTGTNANGKPHNWKCIDMDRKDISAPLRFWYEPQEKLKYIRFDFWFFGQNEMGMSSKDWSDNARQITSTQELCDCLDFVKMVKGYEEKIKYFYNKKLSHLKELRL